MMHRIPIAQMAEATGRMVFGRWWGWAGRWRVLSMMVATTLVTVMAGAATAGALGTTGSVAVSPSSLALGQPTTVNWNLDLGQSNCSL